MYDNSTWENAKPGLKLKEERETNKPSESIDLYACVIKIKRSLTFDWLWDIFQEKYHAIAVSSMEKGGNITGYQISTTYKVSPIPADSSEQRHLYEHFPLKVKECLIYFKSFVDDLYDPDYTGE